MATIAGLQLLGSSALTSYKVNFLPPIPTKANSLPSKEPISPNQHPSNDPSETPSASTIKPCSKLREEDAAMSRSQIVLQWIHRWVQVFTSVTDYLKLLPLLAESNRVTR
ncbi:hypothetical protein K0M31_004421 [Melipona bicolor]|uniref:Uncharacterized protein n=1 Tax=Melipona bicolor TaxID=60889 RepID=A0AA40KNA2_9HYME|nr:hypothetical protein K0M31_004421 [Melipona bicolor]